MKLLNEEKRALKGDQDMFKEETEKLRMQLDPSALSL